MKQTFQQLRKQIELLEAKAEEVRKSEVAEVIAKIKAAIAAYGLTVSDLFGGRAGRSTRAAGSSTKASKRRTGARSSAPKYADGSGNTWVGRGKRPQWIRNALAAGAKLEDLAVGQGGAEAPVEPGAAAVKSGRRKTASKRKTPPVRFRDEAGNTWSGRGPMPKWIKEAIASGKQKQDFAI